VAIVKKLTREQTFLLMLKARKMPTPTPEFRFHPVRKFRWDWAWPEARLALEVEGGVWSGGAHGRGTGIVRDMEKSTLAAEEGWRIIRVTPSNLATEATMDSIHRALQWRTTEA
jgi:very-short-patch-repair endonuclease